MARVKQCDACGRVYIRNRKYQMSADGGYVCGIQTFNSAGRKDEVFDICDSCLTKLFEWLENGKNGPEIFGLNPESKEIDPEEES